MSEYQKKEPSESSFILSPYSQNIRRKILIPFGGLIVLIISLIIFSNSRFQKTYTDSEIKYKLNTVHELFEFELQEELNLMTAISIAIQDNEEIKNVWKSKDSKQLYCLTKDLYSYYNSKFNITHFYFHDTNSVNFLRVHKPDFSGGTINRTTLSQAISSGIISSGIELGLFGTTTFRVVVPWKEKDKIIGYIEFGKEIDLIREEIEQIIDVQMAIYIKKSHLSKEAFESGMELLGRKSTWDRYDLGVFINKQKADFFDKLTPIVDLSHNKHKDSYLQFNSDGNNYSVGFIQLNNAAGIDIGDLIILTNVTERIATSHKYILYLCLILLPLGGLCIYLFNIILRKVEEDLDTSQQKLLVSSQAQFDYQNMNLQKLKGEIVESKTAEQALRESEQKYHELFTSIIEGIAVFDSNENILFCNPAFAKIFDVNPHSMIGSNLMEFVSDHKRGFIKSKNAKYELEILNSKKELRYIHISATARFDANGKFIGTFAAIDDITQKKQFEKVLKESEEKFREIVNNSNDGVVSIDSNQSIKLWNNGALQIFGYKEEEIIGQDISVLIADGFVEKYKKTIRIMTKHGLSLLDNKIFEVSGRHKKGNVIPLEITLSSRTNSDNSIYITGFVRDISERKSFENQLKTLAEFPKSNPNVIMSLNRNAELVFINPAGSRLLKVLKIQEQSILKIFPKNIKNIIDATLLTSNNVLGIESTYANRTWLWFFHPVNSSGIVHGFATEITKSLKQADEHQKLSAAVSQSDNIIIITDPNGLIEYVNPKFTQITGFSLEETISHDFASFSSKKHDRTFYLELWNTLKKGKTWSGSFHIRKKTGSHYWEKRVISPIYNEDEILGYLSIGEDITNELKIQQQLKETDKLSAIGTLAAGVAHEFKNYLTGIIGNASFALDEITDENDPMKETLEQIIKIGENANEIAMSLLTYSKAELEAFAEEDPQQVIASTLKLVEKEMASLSIEIVTCFEKVPLVTMSSNRIQQLILNLLINAQHAIRSHGVITITIIQQDNSIKIKVGDSGCGIPNNLLDKIFDPFFSTKGVWGKEEKSGTGMGLSICKNIAIEHGGDLTANSIKGIGSNFTLTIPILRSETDLIPTVDSKFAGLKIILLTLNKEFISFYSKEATVIDCQLVMLDDIAKILNMEINADLVICDAKYVAKIELQKLIEMCLEKNIPYMLINAKIREYQLEEIYRNSFAVFKTCPTLARLLTMSYDVTNHSNNKFIKT